MGLPTEEYASRRLPSEVFKGVGRHISNCSGPPGAKFLDGCSQAGGMSGLQCHNGQGRRRPMPASRRAGVAPSTVCCAIGNKEGDSLMTGFLQGRIGRQHVGLKQDHGTKCDGTGSGRGAQAWREHLARIRPAKPPSLFESVLAHGMNSPHNPGRSPPRRMRESGPPRGCSAWFPSGEPRNGERCRSGNLGRIRGKRAGSGSRRHITRNPRLSPWVSFG
jgi:hypothetical protein